MGVAVGIDGCRSGWFFFLKQNDSLAFGVAPNIGDLVKRLPQEARVFIDIPIGLIDSGREGRLCDKEARKLLGRVRASSVFPAPCRAVLHAHDYEEAKRISLRKIGKMLSRQAYAITPKILEVDKALQQQAGDLSIREIHPEVCFWALNNRSPVLTRKKSRDGFNARMELMRKLIPSVDTIVATVLHTFLRREVARDDILDALVALVVASTPDEFLLTVPEIPERDSLGLPMEIVYTDKPKIEVSSTPCEFSRF